MLYVTHDRAGKGLWNGKPAWDKREELFVSKGDPATHFLIMDVFGGDEVFPTLYARGETGHFAPVQYLPLP